MLQRFADSLRVNTKCIVKYKKKENPGKFTDRLPASIFWSSRTLTEVFFNDRLTRSKVIKDQSVVPNYCVTYFAWKSHHMLRNWVYCKLKKVVLLFLFNSILNIDSMCTKSKGNESNILIFSGAPRISEGNQLTYLITNENSFCLLILKIFCE